MKKYSLYSESLKDKALISEQEFDLHQEPYTDAGELMQQGYDVVEFKPERYPEFKAKIPVIDWRVSQLGHADCLLRQGNTYRPFHLLIDSLHRIIKKNSDRINSQQPVILIGNAEFVFGLAVKLALSGFIEIIISAVDLKPEGYPGMEKKIKSLVFDLNIQAVAVSDLTTLDQTGSLLITNIEKKRNRDVYELITYFNFLSAGATFIDCNSMEESHLVDEARKAEIYVIDEAAVITNKYEYLLEILKTSAKNSPLV